MADGGALGLGWLYSQAEEGIVKGCAINRVIKNFEKISQDRIIS